MNKMLTVALILFSLSGCAIGPELKLNAKGMGESRVSGILVKNFFSGVEFQKKKLEEFVNSSEFIDASDPRPALRSAGFSCAPTPAVICDFRGTIETKFTERNGEVASGNHQLDEIVVVLDISKKPYFVDIRKNKSII